MKKASSYGWRLFLMDGLLRNELREMLETVGLDADDMSERTLRTAKEIIERCKEKTRIHESSYINYVTIAEAVGLSRKQIAENSDYRTIVDYYRTEPARRLDERLKEKDNLIDAYKAMEMDNKARIDREFDLQARNAELSMMLQDTKRQLAAVSTELDNANARIRELESNISVLRVNARTGARA